MPTRMYREPCASCVVAASSAVAQTAARSAIRVTSDGDRFPPERLQPAPQPFLEVDLGVPAEDLPGARDVGPAHLRIVGGKRLEDELAARAGDADHGLRQLEHRHLVIRVAQVD